MAIYHFSNQIISRKKQQSTIAAAAYRSGERLIDERTNEEKFYKRKVKPITHILAPSHAPEWVYDRQQLWNEVEKKEKQWNAQLAREINVALPKELSHAEQEQLAIEFCTEIFVTDGMVADLSVHRDDEENPHFHVMLTIRPFNEDGSWGNKQMKVKELIDGKLQVKALHITDWNTKEKLIYWREQWAHYANRFLEKNGFSERITHLSNKGRGIETLPTIHEGFVARQMQSEGKESDRIKMNTNRKEYNKTVIELAEAKKEKQIKERTDKYVRRFTPLEKKQLLESAKLLRMFVNYENINTRRLQLGKWQSRLEFHQDSIDKYKKISRIEKETELLNQTKEILKIEANRFLDKYYPDLTKEELSTDQKIEVVETTVSQNKLLSTNDIKKVLSEFEKKHIEKDLHVLLNNRPKFVLSFQQEIQNAENQFEHLRVKNGINFADPSTVKNVTDKELNQMQFLLKQKDIMNKSLNLIDQLYDHQLKEMYPNWDGRNYLTVEQKEFFVMAKEYYGKNIIPEDFSNPPRKYSKEEQKEIIFALYCINCNNMDSKNKDQYNDLLRHKFPEFQIDNQSYKQMFYHECMRYADEIGPDKLNQLYNAYNIQSVGDVEEFHLGANNSFTPHSYHDSGFVLSNGSDFLSILESAIREADRKWREDEFEQQYKNKKKKRRNGMER
ncbi:MobA/MobL family protein [Bacillus sp. sid0103]|uniref:MobQ family relaxase n=1 Tax=Bacillus sp. sid0103 TaxID=2856337 RepID=UPI001C4749EF|nr:MobQ family relaxase [Bacillus sp. sid0103]MBV7508863.1 MobA/MobL family protein [Bacillus sp. sid0103]